MNLLEDGRTRAIWDLFLPARDSGILQLTADDLPLDGRLVSVGGKELVNFVSCSYLGLETDPRVIAGVTRAATKYGTAFSASRAYLSAPPYAEFERLLTQICGAYPVVATTTTLAHFTVFGVMIRPGDVLLLDPQVHNSVQMAAKSVADIARIVPVRHNDTARLERTVSKLLAEPATNRVWYCGDGIYSMYGDVAPVGELVRLLDKYDRLYCYLDDAHGTGTQGTHGRGYVLSQMEQLHPRMIVALSFAKGFGMGGGAAIVVPNPEWQDILRTCGPTMIFSGPLSPPMLGGGIEAARIFLSDEYPAMRDELHRRIGLFRQIASEVGLELSSSEWSPIQYVMLGQIDRAAKVTLAAFEAGYLINICGYPAVAKNHAGVRLTLTRHLTEADIRGVMRVIAEAS